MQRYHMNQGIGGFIAEDPEGEFVKVEDVKDLLMAAFGLINSADEDYFLDEDIPDDGVVVERVDFERLRRAMSLR